MIENKADLIKMDRNSYEATTHGVRISVQPFYLEDESDPEERRYFWAYQIHIENLNADAVQLKSRYWRIIDSNGKIEEVLGEGVVGEQPTIEPNHVFDYTSGVPLKTPSGFMGGHYKMHRKDGVLFDVEIPTFSLDSPYGSHMLN